LNFVSAPAPVLDAITSAASYRARGTASGEVLALFGLRLGLRVWSEGLPAATPPALAENLIRIGPKSSLVPVTVWVRP
jgi:hypothetical protein